MIIRATTKLLNISRCKPKWNFENHLDDLPGEWYTSIISLSTPYKLAIHFLHSPTYITIIIPGKSLNKAIPFLPGKISSILKRNGFESLEKHFKLNSPPEIFTSNSRRMLGYMRHLKFNLEYHLESAQSAIDYDKIEDIHLNFLFGAYGLNRNHHIKKKFVRPIEILNDLIKKY